MTDSIGGAAAGIRGSNSTAQDAIAYLQQAVSQLESARGQLQQACEGTPQADASEALGVYGRAFEAIHDAQRAVQAVMTASEGVAARL